MAPEPGMKLIGRLLSLLAVSVDDEIGHEEGPALGQKGPICHLLQQPHPSHVVRVNFGKE